MIKLDNMKNKIFRCTPSSGTLVVTETSTAIIAGVGPGTLVINKTIQNSLDI